MKTALCSLIVLALVPGIVFAGQQFEGLLSAGSDPTRPHVVKFTLTNKGTSPVEVLTWGTPLNDYFDEEFYQVSTPAQKLQYQGPSYRRSLKTVPFWEIVTMAAGESKSAELDLKQVYNLKPGEKYKVQPKFTVHVVKSSVSPAAATSNSAVAAASTSSAGAPPPFKSVEILETFPLEAPAFEVTATAGPASAALAAASPPAVPAKSPSPQVLEILAGKKGHRGKNRARAVDYAKCTDGTRKAKAERGVAAGTPWLTKARAALAKASCKNHATSVEWLGAADDARFTTAKTLFDNVHNDWNNMKIDCSYVCTGPTYNGAKRKYEEKCNNHCEFGTFGYTWPRSVKAGYNTMHLCPHYVREADDSVELPLTIIHEVTHWFETQDTAYGERRCKALAKARPADAVDNADNLSYFAQYAPDASTCP